MRRSARKRPPFVAGAALALLLALPTSVHAARGVRVAVVPFANATADPRFDALRAGFSDLLASALSRHDAVSVVDRDHLHAIADELGLSLAGEWSIERAPRLGRLLGADLIVRGGFTYLHERFRANAHAFDVGTRALVHSSEATGSLEELADLSAALAADLVRGLSDRVDDPTGLATESAPEPSLHFMRGMSLYYNQLFDHAVAAFMQLLAADPANENARYWIAKSYADGGSPRHARVELEIYLEEHPQGARARDVRALLATLREP